MMRTLVVTAVFLVAGMGLPPDASAQTSAQGQAGILFLLGASKTDAQANARTPGQKPKPGIATSPEAQGKIGDMKLDRPVEPADRTHAKHN